MVEHCPGTLRLTVHDNGIGLPYGLGQVAGNGLQTMRERAEELRGRITWLPGDGTTVVAELPVIGVHAQRSIPAGERR